MKKIILLFLLIAGLFDCSGQNVGIGINAPLAKLHIKSDFEILRLQGQASYISFFDNGGIYNGYLWNKNNSSMDLGTAAGSNFPVTISPNNSTTVSFLGNGNVGIGTLTPAYILDVNGRMRIRNAGSTPGIWFNNTSNSVTPGFVGLLDDNNIGLYGSGTGWSFLMDVNNGHIGIGGMPDYNIRTYIRSDSIVLYAGGTSTTSTAMELGTGKIVVEGAGINTNTSVFVHKSLPANSPSGFGYTVIDNVYCNNHPEAILIVTLNGTYGSGNIPGNEIVTEFGYLNIQVTSTDSFLVFYNGPNSGFYAASPAYAHNRWCIRTYSGNYVSNPDGYNFNVMVVNPY